jgi:hypothetical protein
MFKNICFVADSDLDVWGMGFSRLKCLVENEIIDTYIIHRTSIFKRVCKAAI